MILLFIISLLCLNFGDIYVIWQLITKFWYLPSIRIHRFRVMDAWQNTLIPYPKVTLYFGLVIQFYSFYFCFLWLFIIYLIILHADNSFPSHPSSWSPAILTSQPRLYSFVSILERAVLPKILTKYGLSNWSKNKHLTLYYGRARQLIMRNRAPNASKRVKGSSCYN